MFVSDYAYQSLCNEGASRVNPEVILDNTSILLEALCLEQPTEILCKASECLHSQLAAAKIPGKMHEALFLCIFTEVLQW